MPANRDNHRRPMAEINVVPYIDVMLVLLVIFMITAPLLQQGVEVDLPQASAEPLPTQTSEPFIVTVDGEGRYFVNVGGQPDRALNAQDLVTRAAAVLKRHPDTPVLVRGDEAVSYGAVVSAMVLLQHAGAGRVGLMTEPPPERTGS